MPRERHTLARLGEQHGDLGRDHLLSVGGLVRGQTRVRRRTLTSESVFITRLIRASGSADSLKSSSYASADWMTWDQNSCAKLEGSSDAVGTKGATFVAFGGVPSPATPSLSAFLFRLTRRPSPSSGASWASAPAPIRLEMACGGGRGQRRQETDPSRTDLQTLGVHSRSRRPPSCARFEPCESGN